MSASQEGFCSTEPITQKKNRSCLVRVFVKHVILIFQRIVSL